MAKLIGVFVVASVLSNKLNEDKKDVTLLASDKASENKELWDNISTGSISLSALKPEIELEEGAEYRVEISKVETKDKAAEDKGKVAETKDKKE
ncbi:hypothetical protein ACFFUE_07175 [Bergeyella porcorum]|uniref:hypothetical protein n=1 Tax=Bergeyella porcorum TaxID=1735111 RepID=UPI0035E5F6EC